MQAVILAGGKGTRLRPLTDEVPKALVDVNDTSIIELILDRLKEVEVKEVVIVVHYLKEKIMEKIGNEFHGIKIIYAEQKELNGDADALRYAEQHITDEKFLVIACDSLFTKEHLKKLLEHDSDGTLTVCEVEDARPFGVIMHENGKITKLIEKSQSPPSHLVNTSIYYLPREIFEACKKIQRGAGNEYRIVDAIQLLIDQGKTFDFEKIQDWLDVGTKKQLDEAQDFAKKVE